MTLCATYNGKGVASGNYTSARIDTYGKQSFEYGVMAAKIEIPDESQAGVWPAFWMLGNVINQGTPWPECGEMDIMENPGANSGGGNDYNYGTCHCNVSGQPTVDINNGSGAGSGQYNMGVNAHTTFTVFSITWTSTSVAFAINGTTYYTCTTSTVSGYGGVWEYSQPFFFIANLAIGGGWPGDPNSGTVFPQYYNLQWVRVYQN